VFTNLRIGSRWLGFEVPVTILDLRSFESDCVIWKKGTKGKIR